MKIAPLRSSQTAVVRRNSDQHRTGGGPAFANVLDGLGAAAAGKTEPAPLMGVDNSLLSVQTVDDSTSRAAKNVRRGHSILDRLEQIRTGLLAGVIPREQLNALIRALQAERGLVRDPRLAAVLDEIDLRARVELAKLSIEP